MKAKVIKSEEEYKAALDYIAGLMDAAPGSVEEEELDLFTMLVEAYEKEHYPINLPDPVEAILFRMDQQGLKRQDLVPFIGSQSKVSEVLNHKRQLSLAMMRALHKGLGIPAEVLLREPGKNLEPPQFSVDDFPFTEMFKNGYFPSFLGSLTEAKQNAEELLGGFLAILSQRSTQLSFCRNSDQDVSLNALRAWQAQVLHLAAQKGLPPYRPERITLDLIREMVNLSYYSQGPLMAQELMERNGIALVFLKHLSHTYLDGACFHDSTGRPIVGMTLRHDRLDNFWFTLTHELAHIHLHLNSSEGSFFDDTEHGVAKSCDPQEVEANDLAREMLIPHEVWDQIREQFYPEPHDSDVVRSADQLHIAPAIIAGRLRYDMRDYSLLTSLLGGKILKNLFMTVLAT